MHHLDQSNPKPEHCQSPALARNDHRRQDILRESEVGGISESRVQDIIDLATLAPEVLDEIVQGEQPASLTSDCLVKTGFPAI